MCIGYTDLNKACLKDAYTLPNIDHLVDGAVGHQRLSFLDAYSRYKHTKMHPWDEVKMTHNQVDQLLLQSNVLRSKECQSNLSKVDGQSVLGPN